MARKAPAAVRAALPRRADGATNLPAIDGLSSGAVREIRRYEHSRLRPGAVTHALTEWRRTVHQPIARLLLDVVDVRCPCCDPLENRDVLAQALAALNTVARRELQAAVDPFDDVLRRRTHHDPLTPAEWPWWRRRA